MKKFLGMFLVLGLLFCNVGFTEEPKYDESNINKNINMHEWKHINKRMSVLKDEPIEIITLTKSNWMLKCTILYGHLSITTYCTIP